MAGQWIEALDNGFEVRNYSTRGFYNGWYCPHAHAVIRRLADLLGIPEPDDDHTNTAGPLESGVLWICVIPLENGYELSAHFSRRSSVKSFIPTEEGVLRKIIALLNPTTSKGASASEEVREDAETPTIMEKTIEEAVHGRAPSKGALDSSCSLFDAIWAYLGPNQNGYAYAVPRYLLRFRRTFVSPDPRLSDVTPNVLAAYLGGPGGTESQAQVHAKVLNDFLAWCVGRKLCDSGWNGIQFHEHHPVLGKDRWYKRSPRRPQ